MALVVDISVAAFDSNRIGRLVAVRKEGGVGEMNRYLCSVAMAGEPRVGLEPVEIGDLWIDHHYNDGALELVRKICEAVS